jgi:DNA polymerase-3 subunit delta'
MAWDDLLDQDRVVQALRGAIERDRVAHAYLFYGPDGVGKRAVAIEFARALQCERGEPDACGECNACSKVRRLIHPDVQVFFPQPSDAEMEEIVERIQRLAKNPYAAVDFIRRPSLTDATKQSNKQAFYSVDFVREVLQKISSYRPVEGRYKVVIITDADLFRQDSANAFLKLLEEPPPRTVFILTTNRPDRLLPTILSRCQKHRFDAISPEMIERVLVEKEEVEPETAAMLARMADGSYSRALDLMENVELTANRALVVDFLRQSYAASKNLPALIDSLAGMGRDRVKGVLLLMQSWVRDLVLYDAAGDEARLVNVDQAESIRKFCTNLPHADLQAMVSLIEDAMRLVERNVHLFLVFKGLSQELHVAMHGPHSGRLFVPLAEQPLERVP